MLFVLKYSVKVLPMDGKSGARILALVKWTGSLRCHKDCVSEGDQLVNNCICTHALKVGRSEGKKADMDGGCACSDRAGTGRVCSVKPRSPLPEVVVQCT